VTTMISVFVTFFVLWKSVILCSWNLQSILRVLRLLS